MSNNIQLNISNLMNRQGWPLITFVLMAILFLFSLNSYPMLYPGYDFELHLWYIEKPVHTYNNFWHQCWHYVFDILNISIDEKSYRALIIHRVQTLLTLLLISTSTYMALGIVYKTIDNHLKIQASVIAAFLWLMMHGTYSSPRGELQNVVFHTMSWLQWYSVNYQISLPLFLLASMCFLKAVLTSDASRWVWYSLCSICVLLIAKIHAAELVYFIYVSFCILIFFVLKKENLFKFLILCLFILLAVYVGLKFTYRQPLILEIVFSGDWLRFNQFVDSANIFLIDGGQNRHQTSWHSFYLVSFIVSTLLYVHVSIFDVDGNSDRLILKKGLLLIMASALLAFMMLFRNSSALLAMVVGEGVAWRFGFSSLLFLSIPMLSVYLISILHEASAVKNSMVIITIPLVFALFSILYSVKFEEASPMYNFTKSLIFSLDPIRSFYSTPMD